MFQTYFYVVLALSIVISCGFVLALAVYVLRQGEQEEDRPLYRFSVHTGGGDVRHGILRESDLSLSESVAEAVAAGGISPTMAIPRKHPMRRTRRSRSQ